MTDPAMEPTFSVGIRTKNAEAMVRFYIEVMGGVPYGEAWLDERPREGHPGDNLPGFPLRHRHYWGIRLGGGLLKLMHDAAPLDPAYPQAPHSNRYGVAEICLHVPDAAAMTALFERAEAFGAHIEGPFRPFPRSINRPGGYRYLQDPDGNRVEVFEGNFYSPPSPEFEDGRAWKSREDCLSL